MSVTSVPSKYVNSYQTANERSARYKLYRSLGCNSYEASMIRDWRYPFADWFIQRWILRVTPIESHSQIRNRLLKECKES